MITMGTIIPILIKIEIGTLIISYSIKSATAMVLLKIIADNGYKLDIDKVKEYTKNNKEEASNKLNIAMQRIDKATSSGKIHKNKSARLKSRLMKLLNNME